jgi:hypothetical protein
MYKLMVGVMMLATMSFGTTYNYNLSNPSLSHDSATSWGYNLSLGSGEVITSATLQLTGISDWLPDEWNALYVDLLNDAPTGLKYYHDTNMGATSGTWSGIGSGTEDNFFVTSTSPAFDETVLSKFNYNYISNTTDVLSPYYHKDSLFSSASNVTIVKNGTTMIHSTPFSSYDDLTAPKFNATINFTSAQLTTLNSYLSDGTFGIGVDADCHFKGSFSLAMTSTKVPEPGSLSLMLLGLTSLAGGLFIRRKRK